MQRTRVTLLGTVNKTAPPHDSVPFNHSARYSDPIIALVAHIFRIPSQYHTHTLLVPRVSRQAPAQHHSGIVLDRSHLQLYLELMHTWYNVYRSTMSYVLRELQHRSLICIPRKEKAKGKENI